MNQRIVAGDYFAVLGIPLLQGRLLGVGDTPEEPRSVLVNSAAARALFGDLAPVGREVEIGPFRARVVGVVGDVARDARAEADPTIYHAFAQFGAFQRWPMRHLVRLSNGTAEPWSAIRVALAEVDPHVGLDDAARFQDVVGIGMAEERFASVLLRTFALLALLIASLGIRGVLTQSVARRRHEIGVHMALGADASTVRAIVLRQGVGLSGAGVALGTLAGLALAGTLQFLVYGVDARDPAIFVTVPITVLVLTALSCWLPARDATAIDPRELLRSG